MHALAGPGLALPTPAPLRVTVFMVATVAAVAVCSRPRRPPPSLPHKALDASLAILKQSQSYRETDL
jgi:hypothetical protein